MAEKLYLSILEKPGKLTPEEATSWLRDDLGPLIGALQAGYEVEDHEDRQAFECLAIDVGSWVRACAAAIGSDGDDPVASGFESDYAGAPFPTWSLLARIVGCRGIIEGEAGFCQVRGFDLLSRLLVEQLLALELGEQPGPQSPPA